MQAAGILPAVIRLVHNWFVFLPKQQLLYCSLIVKSVFWISMKTPWQDNHPYDWEALQKKGVFIQSLPAFSELMQVQNPLP